jgi:HAMP domain-containing protein
MRGIGFHVTSEKRRAAAFSGGAEPMALYVSMSSPLQAGRGFNGRLEQEHGKYESAKAVSAMKAKGYDGLEFSTPEGKHFAPFDAVQLKSATGENNEFSPDNPDIRFREADDENVSGNVGGDISDTITIDGVERPRMNSNGKPIHDTDEGIRNFWRWFGSSRVVDEQGRPLVVYHGTTADIEAFDLKRSGEVGDKFANAAFFTSSQTIASGYAQRLSNDEEHSSLAGAEDALRSKYGKAVLEQFQATGKTAGEISDPIKAEYDAAVEARRARRAAVFNNEVAIYGANIVPVYLRIDQPVEIDADGGFYFNTHQQAFDEAVASGADGVIVRNVIDRANEVQGGASNIFAVFSPTQIKSATGNNGEFSPDNPDIRFREQDSPGQWQSTEPGLLDDVIYKLQHKQIDTRRTVQAITKAIGDIADKYNPELKESLYHGRAANETRKFLDFELRPLTRRMIALGVDTPTLEAFLWARHAEERNAHIAKINPRMPDGGSGLTNAQAKQLLAGNDVTINGETIAGVPQSKLDELGELSAMADAMLDKSRELLVENGLETRATIDVWKSDYPHYVPLHREEFEDDRMTGRGLGMSVKGPSGKRAIGSDKPVGNILAAIVSQRELYITRAEKNRVGNALYGLATTAPNEDFWKAVDPEANANRDAEALWAQIKQRMTKLASMPNGDPDLEAIIDGMKAQHKAMMKKAIPGMKKVVDSLVSLGLPAEMAERVLAEPKELAINPRTGMVVERVNPLLRHLDNVVATRINGRDVFVVFDARDKRASRMAIAMKNLDADQLGFLLGNMAKATRYFAAINTQFNPIFGVTNFVRDIQTAMLNLSSTPLADHKKEVATRSLSAMRGIYSDLRAHRAGNLPSSKWAAMFERFKQAGGATGYRDMFETLSDRSKDLQDELKKMSMSKGRRLFTLGQSNPVFAWLSDYNEMMENSVRVAAFSVGIEQGLSDDKAASLAKELTVNFNKKGQVAAQAGAMYAFFNAAVQGSARIAQTLFVNRDGKVSLSSAGKKIVSGGIMIGVAQAFLGALAGWDDEEPPQFVRERSLIIPLGDHYFSVPMPLGFNVLPNIGRITAEFAMSGFKDPAKRIGSLLNVLADTLNPIGNAGVSLQTIAPTVIDPLAALAENKDWTGKPIKRMSFNEEAAGYKNAKDTATVWSKWIAEGLNYLSGGTEHKAGLSSPTPDQIDYLIGQVTGGVGREISKAVQSSTSVFSGEDLPLYKVPLVGKFVGDTKGNAADASRFYANVRDLKAHKAELDGRRKAGQDVAEYLRDNPDARLVVLASRIERRVQELRRAKRELVDQGAPKDRVKQAEDQIAALMKALNNRVQANQRAA